MNCFNFAMSQAEGFAAKAAKGTALSTYTGYVVSYLNKIKAKTPDGMAMSFLSNHDMDRIAGAFITENHMRMAANLYLLGAGSPVIYYGEEIGMRGSRGGENTDANRRLAMLWGDGDMIRDPIGTTYAKDKQIQTTVADQIEDENSMYHYYCRLIAIRHKYPAIARGDYGAVTTSHKNAGGFLITQGEETLLLLHNTSTEAITIDLSTCTGLGGNTFGVLADFIGVSDAKLEGTQLTIGAQTSVILK
jgi:glycosidase